MSRFDGPRQGLATWLIGLIVTVVLLAAIAGGKQGTHFQRKIDKREASNGDHVAEGRAPPEARAGSP